MTEHGEGVAEAMAEGMADGMAEATAEESLGEALGAVARRLRAASLQGLAPYEVTPSQLRALRVLLGNGALRPSELAAHLHIAPRSSTEVVDDLVEKGLVDRSPDPGDRRATLVDLTDHGRALERRLRAARAEEHERILGRLDAADRAHLTRILRQLRE